jgi:hypothetical protein
MQITNEPLNWDSDDMAAWRVFLGTRAGLRLLPKFLENVPSLLSGGNVNEILIRTGEVRGWAEAGRTLLALQFSLPEAKAPAEAYPPLDADEHWNDGKKVNP